MRRLREHTEVIFVVVLLLMGIFMTYGGITGLVPLEITVGIWNPAEIDLDTYFEEGLTYVSTSGEGIVVLVDGSILQVTADPLFSGETSLTVVATDGENITSKDFTVFVDAYSAVEVAAANAPGVISDYVVQQILSLGNSPAILDLENGVVLNDFVNDSNAGGYAPDPSTDGVLLEYYPSTNSYHVWLTEQGFVKYASSAEGILEEGGSSTSGFSTLDACGSNITSNTVQVGDVSTSSTGSDCITIGADNITFDCAGFKIELTAAASSQDGIQVWGNNNVTIKNCRVIGNFSRGIQIGESANTTVFNNTVNTSQDGIRILGSTYIDVFNNKLNHFNAATGDGISVVGGTSSSVGVNITNNTIVNVQTGITLGDATNTLVTSNTIKSGGDGFSDVGSTGTFFANNLVNVTTRGAELTQFATVTNLILFNNTFVNNNASGIDIARNEGFNISHNTFQSIGDSAFTNVAGVWLRGATGNVTVEHNIFTDNSAPAILLAGTSGHMIYNNTFLRNPGLNASGGSAIVFNNSIMNASIVDDAAVVLLDQELDVFTINSSSMTFGSSVFGNLTFLSSIVLSGKGLGNSINFTDNAVIVNSSVFSGAANITFLYNVLSDPVLLRNGSLCPESVCQVIEQGAVLRFNVSGFTNYSIDDSSSLVIFDQGDVLGGSQSTGANEQIYFFANFTNASNSNPIVGATCTFDADQATSTGTAAFNITSSMYEFNTTFTSVGTTDWNITCLGKPVGFANITGTDNITIGGQPQCGATLFTNVTLTGNLTNSTNGTICPGNGLVIAAEGASIDCAGFTIKGSGGSNGILTSGFNNTIIENCNIDGFSAGISGLNSGNVTIQHNSLSNSALDGIFIQNMSSNLKVLNNTLISNQRHGVAFLFNTSHTLIANNTIFNSSSFGIVWGNESVNVTVLNNNITRGQRGLLASTGTSNATIIDNLVSLVNATGISISDGDNITVQGNTVFMNNVTGITLSVGSGHLVENNIVFENGQHGISLSSTDDSIIRNNTATNNTQLGIVLSDSNSTTVENNTAQFNSQQLAFTSQSFAIIARFNVIGNGTMGFSLGLNSSINATNNTVGDNALDYVIVTGSSGRFESNSPGFLSISNSNGSRFVDQVITNYSISVVRFIIENSSIGSLEYTSLVTASGPNLSSDIVFGTNVVTVNSSVTGLNVSANITFFDINFTPLVKRDGALCAAGACTNAGFSDTSVNTSIANTSAFSFLVSSFTNYSISDLACGDEIVVSTTFVDQFTNSTGGICNAEGLKIFTDGVSLDCAGFDMVGNFNATGVLISGDGARVQNCVISNFSDDISINGSHGVIQDNTLFVSNSLSARHIVVTLSDNTSVANNSMTTGPGAGFSGVALVVASNSTVVNNSIRNVTLRAISVSANSSNSLVQGNNITNGNDGIFIGDTLLSPGAFNTTIRENIIATADEGVSMSTATLTVIENNLITSPNSIDLFGQVVAVQNNSALNVSVSSSWDIEFVNQDIDTYSFVSVANLTVRNSNGSIRFIPFFSESGGDLAADVITESNLALVNDSQTGFNVSANISLFNVSFLNSIIKRNGDGCPPTVCTNVTVGATTTFLVPGFTNYTLEEAPICGDTLTENITFFGSILNSTNGTVCPGNGLNIGSDDLTLDCNGVNITGSGSTVGYGVNATDMNFTTVKNCFIHDFLRGVYVEDAKNTSVINNTILRTNKGVFVERTTKGRLVGNNINDSSDDGIDIGVTNKTVVERNTLVNASIEVSTVGGNNTILNNTLLNLLGDGIVIRTDFNSVTLNTIINAVRAIRVIGDNTSVTNNIIINASDSGINFDSADDNQIINNNVSANISVDLGAGVRDTIVRNNILSGKAIDLRVGDTTDVLVENNTGTKIVAANTTNLDLLNQVVSSYLLNDTSLVVRNNETEIRWTSLLNASGTNLSVDVQLDNTLVVVDSDNSPGLNRSANITFLTVAVAFPIIARNGVFCNVICGLIRDAGSRFEFAVSQFTSYTLVEGMEPRFGNGPGGTNPRDDPNSSIWNTSWSPDNITGNLTGPELHAFEWNNETNETIVQTGMGFLQVYEEAEPLPGIEQARRWTPKCGDGVCELGERCLSDCAFKREESSVEEVEKEEFWPFVFVLGSLLLYLLAMLHHHHVLEHRRRR